MLEGRLQVSFFTPELDSTTELAKEARNTESDSLVDSLIAPFLFSLFSFFIPSNAHPFDLSMTPSFVPDLNSRFNAFFLGLSVFSLTQQVHAGHAWRNALILDWISGPSFSPGLSYIQTSSLDKKLGLSQSEKFDVRN